PAVIRLSGWLRPRLLARDVGPRLGLRLRWGTVEVALRLRLRSRGRPGVGQRRLQRRTGFGLLIIGDLDVERARAAVALDFDGRAAAGQAGNGLNEILDRIDALAVEASDNIARFHAAVEGRRARNH